MIAYLKTNTKNVELFYRLDESRNPLGNIIINHGFAEHLGRYDYMSKRLVDAGYNVLRYDLRGHGQSKGTKGHIESYEEFISDADAMVDLMQLNNPLLPTYMLGHSMGGLISTLYALKFPGKLSGQILSGAANGELPDNSNIKAKSLSILAKVTPKLYLKNPVDKKLCSDPKVVQNYLHDPLVLKSATFNFYNEFLNKAIDEVLLNLRDYNLPVLILHGEEDSIVPYDISRRFFDSIQSIDKEIQIYPDLYHEIFNETIKDEIIDYLIHWLNIHVEDIKHG